MSYKKEIAVQMLNDLYTANKVDDAAYNIIYDGITEYDTISEIDEELENLWDEFADLPMNPETEELEMPLYNIFPVGTCREDCWEWFDERHSKGVYYLLYERV